jgi:hypothetical protein
MIPSYERKEWRELILGSFDRVILSHSLKMEVNAIRRKIKTGNLTLEEGIIELFTYSSIHYDLHKKDIFRIFKKVV